VEKRMRLEPIVRTVTHQTIDAYEEILGIRNPLHFDEEYARKTSFGGIIAHGMMGLAYISEMMARAFGDGWYQGGQLDTAFLRPVRPGDTLTTRGQITGQTTVEGETYVVCEVLCETQEGKRVISGTALAKVARLGEDCPPPDTSLEKEKA
jgi:3-hydroxybutyryl-CoA dehydratase